MSGSTTMRASLLLTLEDQLTGGLERLLGALNSLTETIDKISAAFGHLNIGAPFTKADGHIKETTDHIKALDDQLAVVARTSTTVGEKLQNAWEHAAKLGNRLGVIGGAVAGYSVIAPVEDYAKYENVLRHIAITEGLSGDKVDPEIKRLTKLFAEDAQKTGQSSESIAKAYYDLVTTGIPASMLDRVIGAHSAAATAYNISPEALGPAVGALLQNFKVPEADIGSALSAMAQAAKEGRFKVEDFSRELPGVSGLMSLLGVTGRKGADYSFAALETIMKNSSEPSQASAGFVDALRYITDNAGRQAFKRAGIDLPGVLAAGEKAGKNPMDTILDLLGHMTAHQDPLKQAETLGALLHNQQAALAIQALLQHRGEFNALNAKLGGVGPEVVQRDFNTAVADPITQTRLFHEEWDQLLRLIGEGFLPVLTTLNAALRAFVDGFKWMNENFPGLTGALTTLVGAFIGMGAILGVLGFLMPAVVEGFTLIRDLVVLTQIPAGLRAVAVGIEAIETAGLTSLAVGLTALAAPIAALVAGLGVGIYGGVLLGGADDRARAGLTLPELKGADDAAAGITYEWPLAGAQGAKPQADVNIHITHAPHLTARATGTGVGRVTTEAVDDYGRVLGRD